MAVESKIAIKTYGEMVRDMGAWFHFADGHTLQLIADTGRGFQPEGLAYLRLCSGNELVCEFNVYRFYKSSDNHFKITHLSQGYTQKQVAMYWQTAVDHMRSYTMRVHQEDTSDWLIWVMTTFANSWIEDLQKETVGVMQRIENE